MPQETKQAIEWSVGKVYEFDNGFYVEETVVDYNTPEALVAMVRTYFNENEIKYDTFSYDDLKNYF